MKKPDTSFSSPLYPLDLSVDRRQATEANCQAVSNIESPRDTFQTRSLSRQVDQMCGVSNPCTNAIIARRFDCDTIQLTGRNLVRL